MAKKIKTATSIIEDKNVITGLFYNVFRAIAETAQKVLKFGSIEIKHETTNQTDINEAITYLNTLLEK